jgi:hypothetical protein
MVRGTFALLLTLVACSSEQQRRPDASASDGSISTLDGSAAPSDSGLDSSTPDATGIPHCTDAGCFGPINTVGDVVDLLFVVDNSNSMIE